MVNTKQGDVDFAALTMIAFACAHGQANTLWRHAHVKDPNPAVDLRAKNSG
jgi:hypothetical protein